MQLSDFTLSTDPVNDLADAARAVGISEDVIKENQKEWGGANPAIGTVIGGKIYVLQTSQPYQLRLAGGANGPEVGNVERGDIAILGGSALRHEQFHRDNKVLGRSEYEAWKFQGGLLDRINSSNKPFKNQKYFEAIKQGVQNQINYYKSTQGIK